MMDYNEKYLKYRNKYLKLKEKNKIIKLNNNKVVLEKNNYVLNEHESSTNKNTLNCSFLYCKKINEIVKKKNFKKPINILCLGFGIGSIPLQLSKLPNVKKIDCVDIDKSLHIIYLKLFSKFPETKKINFFKNDANKFLKSSNKKYDIIIDDVYNKQTKIYLDYQRCKDLLNTNGYLIINSFFEKKEKNNKLLKKVFDKIKFYHKNVDNNLIIVCKK